MLAVDHMLRWQWIVHLRPYAVWGIKRIRRDGRLLIRTAFLGLFAGSISGCAVGPNFAPPAAPDVEGYIPGKLVSPNPGSAAPRIAGQHFVTGAHVSARWWSAFKSPLLNQLVKQSVDHNPTLQAAEAAIKVAHYNAQAQRGLFFPQVTGNSTSSDILVANPGQVPPIPTEEPQSKFTLV